MDNMQGRVVVMTGGTSGIGLVAAEKLAGMGARLILVARDRNRGEAAVARVKALNPRGEHLALLADLSSISEVRRVAGEIASAAERINVLINNAGALFNSRHLSADGLEMTFATNHLSYFALTSGLTDVLTKTPGARVINTSSSAHRGAKLDFQDLQSSKKYRGFSAYARSKLCNVLFTRELAGRWKQRGVTVNCLHPGFVSTRFGDRSGGVAQSLIRVLKLFAISPEKGAETIVYLASSTEVADTTGAYFYRCRVEEPSAEAQNDETAARLWEVSETLMAGSR